MRLWRTGASELLYSTEEDDYFDVSVHMFDVFFNYKCISFYQPEYLDLQGNEFALSKDLMVYQSVDTVSDLLR